jgi:UDP-N-acetylglucosamine 2-epimerase (non-hydrolysing)
MNEVLRHYGPGIRRSRILSKLGLAPKRYFVVSAHREENVDDARNLRGLLDSLDAVAKRYGRRIIFSTHPRTHARLSGGKRSGRAARIEFLKPLGFLDYIKLQMSAYCVLSDSGTLTEESSLLGFPAVMIRQAHERPEGMDEAAVILSDLKPARVLDAIDLAVAHDSGRKNPFRIVPDYTADNVSRKVVRVILSYTDYVNRTVWRK